MYQDPYRKYANWKTKTQDESDFWVLKVMVQVMKKNWYDISFE